jgi:alpha-tubulin suppressor-like RCC1 family protein
MVAAGYDHTVGLETDGTVVAVGDNTYGQCNVGNWTDIIQVSAGSQHTVRFKSDGTVVAAGIEVELAKWNLIEAVP